MGSYQIRVMSELRVELYLDEEARNWHYRVPALHINGGGTPTRQDAARLPVRDLVRAGRRSPRLNRHLRCEHGVSSLSKHAAPSLPATTSARSPPSLSPGHLSRHER